MENKDSGADTMVILNMEVEKRILQTLIQMFEPPNGPPDDEVVRLRYEAQAAFARWMVAGFTGQSYDMQGAVRHVVGQMMGATVSPYDSPDIARYNVESAIRTMLNGHLRVTTC